MLLPHSSRQGLFSGCQYRPFGVDTVTANPCDQGSVPDGATGIIRPILKYLRLPKEANLDIRVSVSGLREVIGKAAITWTVALIVIFALNGQSLSVSVMDSPFVKAPKASQPRLADSNAPTAVARVVSILRVSASLFDPSPQWIGWQLPSPDQVVNTGLLRAPVDGAIEVAKLSSFSSAGVWRAESPLAKQTLLFARVHLSPPGDVRLEKWGNRSRRQRTSTQIANLSLSPFNHSNSEAIA